MSPHVGCKAEYVDWPAGEPIPETMEQALALGWEVEGEGRQEVSKDERLRTGNMDLSKRLGTIQLRLRFPFRAEFSYGKPHSAKAIVRVPDDAERRSHGKTH
jgi:hypothetical protein